MFGVFQRGPERAKGGRCVPPRLLSDADGAPRGRCPTAVADGPGDGQRLPAVRFGFRRPAQRGQGLRSVPEGVGLTLGMVESTGDVQGGGGIREAAVGFAEEDQAMPARGSGRHHPHQVAAILEEVGGPVQHLRALSDVTVEEGGHRSGVEDPCGTPGVAELLERPECLGGAAA